MGARSRSNVTRATNSTERGADLPKQWQVATSQDSVSGDTKNDLDSEAKAREAVRFSPKRRPFGGRLS